MNAVLLFVVFAGVVAAAHALEDANIEDAFQTRPTRGVVHTNVEEYALMQSFVQVAAGTGQQTLKAEASSLGARPEQMPMSLVAQTSLQIQEFVEEMTALKTSPGDGETWVRVLLIVVICMLVICIGSILLYFVFDSKTSSRGMSVESGSRKDLAKPYIFETEVIKTGPDEMLGMDVKYVQGRLLVVQVIPGGAIDRMNKENLARNPRKEELLVGDLIQRINNVESNDQQMVAECTLKTHLSFLVARMPPGSMRGQARSRPTDFAKAILSGSISSSSTDYERLNSHRGSQASQGRRPRGSVDGFRARETDGASSYSEGQSTVAAAGPRKDGGSFVSQGSARNLRTDSPHAMGSPHPGGWTLPNGDHMPPPLLPAYVLSFTEARFAVSVSALAAFRYEGGLDVYDAQNRDGGGHLGSQVLRVMVRQATDRPGRLLEVTPAKPGSPPCAVFKPRGWSQQNFDADSYEILSGDGELCGYLDPRPDSSYAITNNGGAAMLLINEGEDDGLWLTVTTRDGEPIASVACTSNGFGGSEHLEILVRSRTDAVLVVSSVLTMLLLTADHSSPGSQAVGSPYPSNR